MSFSHHEIDKFKGSSFAKITKIRQKIDEKTKRIWSGEKKPKKSLKNRIWDGLGLLLGGVWEGLGRLLGTLGRFLAVFWAFKIELFFSIGPR